MTNHKHLKQGKPTLRKIPFLPMFEQVMLKGVKTATTRGVHFGFKGDWFKAFGATFLITDTANVSLAYVKDECWKEEGVQSPEAFEEIWNRIHPRKQYDPKTSVVIHRFKLAPEYQAA